MLSNKHPAASLALLPMLLLASACAGTGGYPPLADVKAVTESKPVPTDEIATDPQAEANYNVDVESWGDRLRSAGLRLCEFFEETGMPMKGFDCPDPEDP